jgi:hypothetical protein
MANQENTIMPYKDFDFDGYYYTPYGDSVEFAYIDKHHYIVAINLGKRINIEYIGYYNVFGIKTESIWFTNIYAYTKECELESIEQSEKTVKRRYRIFRLFYPSQSETNNSLEFTRELGLTPPENTRLLSNKVNIEIYNKLQKNNKRKIQHGFIRFKRIAESEVPSWFKDIISRPDVFDMYECHVIPVQTQ